MLNDPEWARVLPALLLLKTPRGRDRRPREAPEERQNDVLDPLIRPGVAEGLLSPAPAIPRRPQSWSAPLFFAQLSGSVPIDAGFIDRTVDRFLATYRPT